MPKTSKPPYKLTEAEQEMLDLFRHDKMLLVKLTNPIEIKEFVKPFDWVKYYKKLANSDTTHIEYFMFGNPIREYMFNLRNHTGLELEPKSTSIFNGDGVEVIEYDEELTIAVYHEDAISHRFYSFARQVQMAYREAMSLDLITSILDIENWYEILVSKDEYNLPTSYDPTMTVAESIKKRLSKKSYWSRDENAIEKYKRVLKDIKLSPLYKQS